MRDGPFGSNSFRSDRLGGTAGRVAGGRADGHRLRHGDGLGSPRKVNFASAPSPSTSTNTIWPGRISSNRIFSLSASSISRWMVRRNGRAPSTGSNPRSPSSALAGR